MFTFIEAPLLAFLFAPARARAGVESFNRWLGRNGRTLAAGALLIVGVLEIAHGAISAVH
jgi:Sap-like sulfolipid-1-addressing protein